MIILNNKWAHNRCDTNYRQQLGMEQNLPSEEPKCSSQGHCFCHVFFMTVDTVKKLMPFLILLLPIHLLTMTSLLNHIGNDPKLIINVLN